MSTTIESTLSTDELGQLFSESIGMLGEYRALLDMQFGTTDADREKVLQAQSGLISLWNRLGDVRPAPSLAAVNAARLRVACLEGNGETVPEWVRTIAEMEATR